MSTCIVLASYSNQKQKTFIEADLNKLYDNKPTSVSLMDPKEELRSPVWAEDYKEYDYNNENSVTPTFDFDYSGDVKGVLGKTALLNCRVKNIGNKTVSWLREHDTHLLTIGRLTYTSDTRFKAIHRLFSEDYLLQIKPTSYNDSGEYACQISTTPPNSLIVTLTVAEPRTEILGGPEIHIKEGSTLNLTCLIIGNLNF